MGSAHNSAYNATWDAPWDAPWDAILALIAYDSASRYLEMDVDEVEVFAALGVGPAILMLETCKVLAEIDKTKEVLYN